MSSCPHPDYVRFATHFSFRPDFCEAGDPECNGILEALVGYAKSDLVVPAQGWDDIDDANTDAKTWCHEINARVHSEICAIPVERLVEERRVMRALPSLRPPLRRGETRKVDRLSTVRLGSARYSVPFIKSSSWSPHLHRDAAQEARGKQESSVSRGLYLL